MRMVFALVLLVGVALAGGAVYLANGYITQHRQALAAERAQSVDVIDVVVATKPLRYGHALTLEDMAIVRWPVPSLPEGAFHTAEEMFPDGPDEPRVVLRPMEKGEAILAVKVTKPGEDAGLTSRLDKGMRAFTIHVDATSGVSGFLRPGDHVDVYWSGRGVQTDSEITKLITTSVQLIAVDQKADFESGETIAIANTVTVQVLPQAVAKLAQAQQTGRLTLALVGAGDETIAVAEDVDQRALLGIEAEQVVEVQQEEVCTIRTRRGAEVVEIPIPCTN